MAMECYGNGKLESLRHIPHFPAYIDITRSDFIAAITECLRPSQSQQNLMNKLSTLFSSPNNLNKVLPCLSVRSGLDIFLSVKQFPIGSKILITAINIPHIVDVIKHHGLIPQPLDIDLATLETKLEEVDNVISDKTVAIYITHLFNKRCPVERFHSLAAKYGLCIIEDCAEAFCGSEWLGDPLSDLSMFSFGPIKFTTALGGALLKVKDVDVWQSMNDVQTSYPAQSVTVYIVKLLKYLALSMAMRPDRLQELVLFSADIVNFKYKPFVVGQLRRFRNDLMIGIRQQPCDALLFLMYRRLSTFDRRTVNATLAKGDYVARGVSPHVIVPGLRATVANYWLFPIVVADRDQAANYLNSQGIEAFASASQLQVMPSQPPAAPPPNATFLMENILYLPVHRHVDWPDLDYIISRVAQLNRHVAPLKAKL